MEKDSVFIQIVKSISGEGFDEIVDEYNGNRYTKKMFVYNLLQILIFVQIMGLESLRDVEAYVSATKETQRCLGMKAVSRSTLAEALQRVPSEIFETVFNKLLKAYTKRLGRKHAFALANRLAIIDSTTINVGVNRVPWAEFRTGKGAVKMHLMLGHHTGINTSFPMQMHLTNGKCSDVRVARKGFTYPNGYEAVFDRGYESKVFFKELNQHEVCFVCRAKMSTYYYAVKSFPIAKEDRNKVISDEEIKLSVGEICDKHSQTFRRVVLPPFQGHTKNIILITNDFTHSALEIGEIYRLRWQIETFFKWIKQHLKIKTFLGTSTNAVRTQLFIALIVTLVITYMKLLANNNKPFTYILRNIKHRLHQRYLIIEILNASLRHLKETLPQFIPPIQTNFLNIIFPGQ